MQAVYVDTNGSDCLEFGFIRIAQNWICSTSNVSIDKENGDDRSELSVSFTLFKFRCLSSLLYFYSFKKLKTEFVFFD